jgi:single stranded DNA-binding protein
MPYLNLCNFIGHTGKDAELKQSKDGTKQWAEFSLAVSTGTVLQKKTVWVKCSVWGRQVERAVEKIKKGDPVFVSGKFDAGLYTNKSGETKIDVSLSVNEFQILKGKPENPLDEVTQFNSTVPAGIDDGLDNIPF